MSKTKKKSIFLIIAVVLLAVMGGVAQAVYSTDSFCNITYNGDVWRSKDKFNKTWYIRTAKNDDGTPSQVTFGVDLGEFQWKGNNSLPAPFSVTGKTIYENGSTKDIASNEIEILKDDGNSHVYNVKFKPSEALKDGEKVSFHVEFNKCNSWKIEGQQNLDFNFVSDNTDPKLTVNNLSEIETRNEFYEPVSLKCTLDETNLDKVIVDIDKYPYDKAGKEKIAKEIDWDNRNSNNSYKDYISLNGDNGFNVNFNDGAYYEVRITLIDKAGNKNSDAEKVIKLQKRNNMNAVQVAQQHKVEKNNYIISNDKKVTFKFVEFNSGFFRPASYTLSKDGNQIVDNKTNFDIRGEFSIDIPKDGIYTLVISYYKWFEHDPRQLRYTVDVDTKAPELSTLVNGNPYSLGDCEEYYFNNLDNLKMNITDCNLTASNIKVIKDGQELKNVSNNLDLSFNKEDQGVYEITASASDKAGNELNKSKSKTYKFIIDKDKPTITVDGVCDGQKIKKDDDTPTVYITASDQYLDEDKNVTQAVMTKKVKGKADEKIPITLNNNIPVKLDVDEDAIYTIDAKAQDKAKNSAEFKPITFEKDTVSPDISLSVDDEKLTDEEYNEYQEEDNDKIKCKNNENGIKIAALVNEDYPKLKEDGTVDEDATTITVEKTSVDQEGIEGETTESEKTYKSGDSVILNEEGKYKVIIKSTDECGNYSERTLNFVLDKTNPNLSIDGQGDYNYYNEHSNIVIKSNDAFQIGGKVEIVYEKIIKNLEGDDESSGVQNKELSINNPMEEINLADLDGFDEEAEYKIYSVTAIDRAENKSILNDIFYTIDRKAPDKEINGLEDNKEYYNSDRTITVDTTDVNLDKVVFTISKDGEEIYSNIDNINNLEQNGATGEFNIRDRSADGKFNLTSDGRYTITFESQDKAGNGIGDVITKDFVIDKTAPEITIDDYDSLNNSYINYDKLLNVRIKDQNLESDVSVTYVNIIKKYPDGTESNKDYVFNLNGECPDYSDLYNEFTEDAEYTVTVTAQDKAGNISVSNPLVFTVDKTAPAQSITGVDNDAYYNVDKDVQFLSIDNNQNINIVSVTRDGEPYSIGEFTVEGIKAYLNYTFSQEGTYDIVFTTTDKANNTSISNIRFTIDKTAPNIKAIKGDDGSEIKFGEYINRIFTPQFVLDKSEDFITQVTLNGADITGNVSMASQEMEYKYTVTAQDKAGNVTTMDTSFTVDTINPAITLSGIMSGFFNEDVTPEFDITDTNLDYANTSSTLNGEKFTSGTKIDTQNDFNLKLIGTDLATNSNSQSVSFTIDKDGPVISFKNPISGQYFTEDFIPEFLINDLSDYTIIALTLDGEEYHIGDVIDEEGKHVLYIEVMDKAGNVSELSVEFILDKTAPKFIVDGVADGETYYDAVSAEVYLDNPLDKINTITVNGEAADGEVTDDYGQQVINLKFNDVKDYEVMLKGTDEAGNSTVQTVNFTVAEKTLLSKITTNKKLLYSSAAAVSAVVALGATRLVIKRRRKISTAAAADNEVEIEE